MAEKIEVGVVIKGADKASSDMTKVTDGAKALGSSMEGAGSMTGVLESGLDKMTSGAYSGFKSAAMGVKTFITGLKMTKTAIIATGIGALVVAFGLLVTYWDDIKNAVSGVTAEQNKLLITSQQTTAAAQAEYDITLQTEASLKNKGMSERELLQLKRDQLATVIQTNKDDMAGAILRHKVQTAAALENQKIAAGILGFLQLPITLIMGSVDALTFAMQKLGVIEEATNMAADSTMFIASFLFDAEAVEAEGAATIAEMENQIRILENTEATYELQEKKRREDATAARAEGNKEKVATEADLAAELARLRAENLADAETKALALLELERGIERQKLEDQKASSELLEEFDANYETQRLAIIKSFADEAAAAQKVIDDKIIADAEILAAKKIAIEEATAKAVRAARLGLVAAGFDALKVMAKTEEGQKKLAIAQILVNQGIAMSNAVVAGLSAAAKMPQPAGLFAAPGFVATALGIALTSFASIKGVMNQAGAATDGLDLTTPSLGGGGGGGGSMTQLALTPDLAGSFGEGTLELPAVQAYIIQNDIATASALQAELQNQATL